MSDQGRETVKIELLGKSYNMTCGPDDVEELIQTGEKLNEKLVELAGADELPANKLEPIIVAVALNLVNDLMDKEGRLVQMEYRLDEMVKRLDAFDEKRKKAFPNSDW